jgi:hypothetical protein
MAFRITRGLTPSNTGRRMTGPKPPSVDPKPKAIGKKTGGRRMTGPKPPSVDPKPKAIGKKTGGPRTPSQDISKLLASSRSGLGKSRTGGTGGTRKKVGGLSNRMNQRLALQRKLANQRRTAKPTGRRARPIKGLGNAGRRRRIV